MPISFFSFLSRLAADPVLMVTVVLTLSVILVNGWTDAPNAIATAVTTGAIRFRPAVLLAAVCNLFGVVCMTAINATVAETIYTIADFGADAGAALNALCAALVSIVLWAVLAWRFGIPTSESHALVAGVTGAALARPGGFSNLHGGPWVRVLLGLMLSVLLSFYLGRLVARLLRPNRGGEWFYKKAQVLGAGAMAFLHGAQDGQKFMGVFLLGVALAEGRWDSNSFVIPLWLMVLCAVFMSLGTCIGGRRIINTVGRDMVPLNARQGFAADIGGGACLLFCTLLGLPVSTTHTKTAAVLGVGAAQSPKSINPVVVRSIALTWILTFPGCGIIGFFMARLFLQLF